jgi:hypothetical protein
LTNSAAATSFALMKKPAAPSLAAGFFLAQLTTLLATPIIYADFTSPAGLLFQGDAALQTNFVRLTPCEPGKIGGLWLRSKQPVLKGFETTFQFRITEKRGHGGDGFTFVLQNNPMPLLGGGGSYLGFFRGGSAFVIRFDTYHWHRQRYVKHDEIAVTSCGGESSQEQLQDPLGTVTGPSLFSDGQIHTARVRYTPGNLLIFLDDLQKPLLTVSVQMEDFVAFNDGLAWAGFTASSGDDSENHDILAWSFNQPGDAPAPPPSLARKTDQIQATQKSAAPANSELSSTREPPDVPLIGLPVIDGTSRSGRPMMQVPSSIGLSQRVYASTNLTDWVLVTNLHLYFTDPNAPDYDHRFFVFQK